ncbi:MAG TPA: chemotaxis protein CheD [Bacillota bacterium]|nr:chemotaxis protein CheD [Bacillota bacterium]HOK68296.1 chemotaxis protein CheD [Bacillota bacterium]HPP84510.1 chemotaxis protein CheD [Bacillota bacterium]
MGNLIVVGIADLKVASGDDVLITYALGSCVGTCIYDKTAKVIGLSHVLLASKHMCLTDNNIYKYADTAIKELVRQMVLRGASVKRMTAKIAGGAHMFASSTIRIGEQNSAAVMEELKKLGIPLVAADIGDNYGRTMECWAADGKVVIKSILKGNKIL